MALRKDHVRSLDSHIVSWMCGAVSVFAMVPFAIARFPPSVNYYHWVFQGQILARLLSWIPDDGLVTLHYRLEIVPIPNLAAPVTIAMLSSFLTPLVAGRVFGGLCVLVFGLGFAYLVRSVQQRPTAIELLGFVWAYGYLMYSGYLSNQFALGVAFFALGKLHRMTRDSENGLRCTELLGLAALGTAVYLSHLFGWLVFLLAVGIYATTAAIAGRKVRGLMLLSTLTPSLVLLGWYVLSRVNDVDVKLYAGLELKKLLSIAEPLMPLFRTIPFPPLFSVFWGNVLVWLGLFAVVALNLDRTRQGRSGQPLLLVGGLLGCAAVLLPIRAFGEMSYPDARFVLPGLLLLIASLPSRKLTVHRALAAACLVMLVVTYHVVEYRQTSRQLSSIDSAARELMPPGVPTYSIALYGGHSTCRRWSAGSCGVTTLKWFDLMRLLDSGMLRADLLETSVVRHRGPRAANRTTRLRVDDDERLRLLRLILRPSSSLIQLTGCPDNLLAVQKSLGREFEPIAMTEWSLILESKKDAHRRPSEKGTRLARSE